MILLLIVLIVNNMILYVYHAANQIVVTGEWCHEVLHEYLSNDTSSYSSEFDGRGIQFYLGFHHGEDTCR